MKRYKNQGITLVALVVTIVVLIIVAGITIKTFNGSLSQLGMERNNILNDISARNATIGNLTPGLNKDTSAENSSTIEVPSGINFAYSPATWTNQNVTVSLTTEIQGYSIQCSIGNTTNWNNVTDGKTTVSSNNVIYARLVNGNNYGNYSTGNVQNIDKVLPTITTPTLTANSDLSITASVTASDALSGLSKIDWYYKKTSDTGYSKQTDIYTQMNGSLKGETTSTTKSHNFSDLLSNTSYTVYAVLYDVAGNSVTSSTAVVTTATQTTFSTEYGRIDVIWLDKNNNVISQPLAPVLNGMTPVKWTGMTESTTTASDSSWYNYIAGSGTSDNLSSHWANATNSDGSYFVWIPRYAYRITYYTSQSSTTPSGYCDGRGIVETNGTVRYTLDSGITTVAYNGRSYIVHPAFETNLDLGGWDSDLSGIWVSKYEMCNSDATLNSIGTTSDSNPIKSLPNVESTVCDNEVRDKGQMFNRAKNYDVSKYSHMMKNSEWGATAYLAHSQYGRNGNDIDINNVYIDLSDNFHTTITGNGGGSSSVGAVSSLANAYNTDIGAKASSTGNIYGIYDLSGGNWESVAAFNDTDTNNIESTYVNSTDTSIFARPSNPSTKWATKYYNTTTNETGSTIYTVGKFGDATKEVYASGTGKTAYSWFSDFLHFPSSVYPLIDRGGFGQDASQGGIFACIGIRAGINCFAYRTVLANN